MVQFKYHEDIASLLETVAPQWRQGQAVEIEIGSRVVDYFDVVISTRRNDDEPILEMLEFFKTRTGMKKSYATRLFAMSRRYAAKTGLDAEDIKRRFKLLRNEVREPGSAWD